MCVFERPISELYTLSRMFPQSGRSVPKSAFILKLLVVLFLSTAATSSALARARAKSSARSLLGLAFIFHPALQENYQLDCERLGEWKAQPAWLVHFQQRPHQPRRLQGFKVGEEL